MSAAYRRQEAERRVLAVRGSWDAPGFEACVHAELEEMRANKTAHDTGKHLGTGRSEARCMNKNNVPATR